MSTPALLTVALSLLVALPQFEVEDQFRKKHDTAEIFGGDRVVVILAGAERSSGEAIRDWVRQLPKSPRVYGIAKLDGLPFFVPKGSVRSSIAENTPNTPVLCDFDGDAYKALGLPEELVTARVYWRGQRVGEVRGPVTPAGLAQLTQLVRTATRAP